MHIFMTWSMPAASKHLLVHDALILAWIWNLPMSSRHINTYYTHVYARRLALTSHTSIYIHTHWNSVWPVLPVSLESRMRLLYWLDVSSTLRECETFLTCTMSLNSSRSLQPIYIRHTFNKARSISSYHISLLARSTCNHNIYIHKFSLFISA